MGSPRIRILAVHHRMFSVLFSRIQTEQSVYHVSRPSSVPSRSQPESESDPIPPALASRPSPFPRTARVYGLIHTIMTAAPSAQPCRQLTLFEPVPLRRRKHNNPISRLGEYSSAQQTARRGVLLCRGSNGSLRRRDSDSDIGSARPRSVHVLRPLRPRNSVRFLARRGLLGDRGRRSGSGSACLYCTGRCLWSPGLRSCWIFALLMYPLENLLKAVGSNTGCGYRSSLRLLALYSD